MGVDDDISAAALADVLGQRAVRSYPALLSTEAVALAWAREGAPSGAVVVAGYQASPRGRAGLPWTVRSGTSLGFSVVLHPDVPVAREGWTYEVAVSGLADALGAANTIAWPDEVRRAGRRLGAVGTAVELGPGRVSWAVVNVLVTDPPRPRGPLLARILEAIESRLDASPEAVLADYDARCETLGRRVRARMIPMGPAGPRVEGKAVGTLADGSLTIETPRGSRVAVRPQNLGLLDELEDPDRPDAPCR